MFTYATTFVLTVLLLPNIQADEQVSNEIVKITLYYESLCPYCKAFITEQFYPGFQKLGSYLKIDLVPYGNAKYNKTGDSYNFTCQHGEKECFGNKIQACGLAEGKSQSQNMEFINCLESHTNPGGTKVVKKCALKLGARANPILSCANGLQGNELLAKYGDRTSAIRSLIKGVPSVFVNDKFDEAVSDALVENFVSAVCSLLKSKPSECLNSKDSQVTDNLTSN